MCLQEGQNKFSSNHNIVRGDDDLPYREPKETTLLKRKQPPPPSRRRRDDALDGKDDDGMPYADEEDEMYREAWQRKQSKKHRKETESKPQ